MKPGYRGLDKPRTQGLDGLDKPEDNGLSIVELRTLTLYRQIVKAICRQIDKPYMPICPYHGLEGLSNPQNPREYKEIPNTPIYIQTISSGYKGLVNMGG